MVPGVKLDQCGCISNEERRKTLSSTPNNTFTLWGQTRSS